MHYTQEGSKWMAFLRPPLTFHASGATCACIINSGTFVTSGFEPMVTVASRARKKVLSIVGRECSVHRD